MAKVTITNPTPFKTNRRKCGWGSALTTCDICGKIMVGHNRGVCSKCMRSLGGDRALAPLGLFPPHFNYNAALRAHNLAKAAKHENGGTN